MKQKVLVVEDESPIRMGLCDVLAYHGIQPLEAVDGEEGLAMALAESPALVLLDVMMPKKDGFTVCSELRPLRPSMGIIMLTAKGSEADILKGFQCGADDYIPKPFSVAQLMARVNALLRRTGAVVGHFRLGEVEVDPQGHRASLGDRMVELSAREVELLSFLVGQAGAPVTRETLLKEVWGYAKVERVETRCVDMSIVKLRRRLTELTDVDLIQTVRGVGYRCAP